MKTKEFATELREQGLSYADIAAQTGYSLDWCKKNLNTVQKNKQEKVALAEAIKRAQSQDAITNGEIKYLVRGVYPVDGTKQQEETEKKAINRFKAAINRADGTLTRPYWMQPEDARMSFKLVLGAVDIIQQHMTDVVTDIRKQLDLDMTYDNSLRYAIIKMLQGSTLVQEGLENHCDTLNNIANELEARNSEQCTDMHSINTCVKKCALKYPSVQKCEDEIPVWFDEMDAYLTQE